MGKRRTLEIALALAVFGVVAMVAFRPLFWRWNTLPTYERGSTPAMALADRNLNVWILAWVAHALVDSPASLFDGNILHPAPDTLAGSEHMLAHVPFTVPAYLLGGNAAYVLKAMMLESILLTALAGFLVVRHHTGDAAAGIAAGVLLTLAPWRFEPRGVHGGVAAEPQYLGFQFLPLALLALAVYVERGRRVAWLALAASMALQALASFYLGYASFAVVPAYAAVLLWARARDAAGSGRGWREALARVDRARVVGIVSALAIAGAVVIPTALPYLRLRAAGVVPSYGIEFVAAYSTPPWWYLGPRGFELVGPVAALATIALGLLRLAQRVGLVAKSSRRTRAAAVGEAAAWVLLAVGLVLAWGPYQELPGGWRVPLPFLALWKLVPGFSAMRGAGRFVVVLSLACSLLAGHALAATRPWLGRARWLAAAAVVAATVFLAAREPVSVAPSGVGDDAAPAYRWLAARPRGEVVLELPAKAGEDDLWGLTTDSQYMLASTIHWQPLLNGYTAYEPPSRYVVSALAQRLPEADALERLSSIVDVRWILVHRRLLHARQRAAFDAAEGGLARLGLVERARFGDDVLYEVTAPRAVDRRDQLLRRNPEVTLEGTPRLPLDPACRAGALEVEVPAEVRHSYRKARFEVRLANRSRCVWPGLGTGTSGLVMLEYEWVDASGKVVVAGAPGRLTRDVAGGETVDEPLYVLTPRGDATYRLRITARQQGEGDALATWEGSLRVEPARVIGPPGGTPTTSSGSSPVSSNRLGGLEVSPGSAAVVA